MEWNAGSDVKNSVNDLPTTWHGGRPDPPLAPLKEPPCPHP